MDIHIYIPGTRVYMDVDNRMSLGCHYLDLFYEHDVIVAFFRVEYSLFLYRVTHAFSVCIYIYI